MLNRWIGLPVVDVEPVDQSVLDSEDVGGIEVVPRFAQRAGRPDLHSAAVGENKPISRSISVWLTASMYCSEIDMGFLTGE